MFVKLVSFFKRTKKTPRKSFTIYEKCKPVQVMTGSKNNPLIRPQAVLACALVVATAAAYNGPLAGGLPAAQYPAGVSPQACPNYPNCANPAVAVSPNALPQQYAAAPQYQQPQYQPAAPQYQQQQYQPAQYQPAAPQQPQYSPVSQYNPVFPQQYNQAPARQQQYSPDVQNALDRGEYIGDGDYHGEGLAEALAPGHAGTF